MQVFEYTGQLPQGTAITGTLEAADIDDARRHLADLTIHVSSLTQATRIRPRRPLSREDLQFFNQQLAALADNKIALDEGLRAIARDLRRGRLKATIEKLAADLEAGVPLDEAVEKQAGRFPPLFANVLKAGSENNNLGATLLNLNNHLGLLESTRRIVLESLTYPLIVLALFAVLVTMFLVYIVPGFESLVSETVVDYGSDFGSSATLPGPTRLLFEVSQAWPAILISIAGGLIVFVVLWKILQMFPAGRRLRGRLMAFVPGLSAAYRASLVARFTNAAALGARSGQPLPSLLRSAAGATGNGQMSSDAERIAQRIEAGELPEQTAIRTQTIPSMVTYAIQIAGGRGELAETLGDLAHHYEAMARHKMTMVRILIGPLAIILIAVCIGIAAFALVLPIIQVIQSITGM